MSDSISVEIGRLLTGLSATVFRKNKARLRRAARQAAKMEAWFINNGIDFTPKTLLSFDDFNEDDLLYFIIEILFYRFGNKTCGNANFTLYGEEIFKSGELVLDDCLKAGDFFIDSKGKRTLFDSHEETTYDIADVESIGDFITAPDCNWRHFAFMGYS